MINIISFLNKGFVLLENYSLPVTDSYELVLGHVMLLASDGKVKSCLTESFTAQGEGPPVDCDRLPTPQLTMHKDCLFRVDMLRTQDDSRFISSNWQDSEVKWSKHPSNFLEDRTIAGIP